MRALIGPRGRGRPGRWVVAAALALPSIAACRIGGPPPDPNAGDTYTKIDDMEGSSGMLEWASPPGTVAGSWFSYADDCDDVSPVPTFAGGSWSYAALPAPYETLPGVTSRQATRFRTTAPLVNRYGAGIQVNFALPLTDGATATPPAPSCAPGFNIDLFTPVQPVDLTAYRGLTFWARAVPGAGMATQLAVIMQDVNTDPRGGICDPTMGSAEACYNGYRLAIDLTDTFVRYSIDFASLQQEIGWGHRPNPSILDQSQVIQLDFEVDTPGGSCAGIANICAGDPPSLTFEVWIDDLYFINR